MRKIIAALLLLIMISLAGCKGASLMAVNPDGNISEVFINEHLEISPLYKNGQVSIKVRNLTDEALVLFWPEGNLTLPDGGVLSIGYMSNNTKSYRAVYNRKTGLVELEISESTSYQHTEETGGTRYIDNSPSSIGPSQSVGYLLGIIFTSENPSDDQATTENAGIRSTNPAVWLNRMKSGERMTWRLSYRLMESDLAFDTEVTLELADE